ncbi:cytochrome c3 family protein [Microbulbifer halophilus]|uniref:nitrite reductase (cytochrome; ammonia-forming) n=1 Tax=Microbulbifer halophilus TaxID=453963 RepID=A0ABW5E7J8_9GAMM|nr:cytochrome c3 family protein [Microbulbifer halophilus]MCW8125657.1 cytochrome c3 family protein [Microbulbifer halophilus]
MKGSRFNFRRFRFWHWGLIVTLLIAASATYNLELSDKSLFISGEPTHGHHQMEMACSSCHSDGFSGADAMQQACLDCHAEELEIADDSHPRTKFLDPRNAALLGKLDARQCVTCHVEHKPEITRDMGVTLAGDFCFHCHSDIAENRPSHRELAFDSCASAGCHNFHDNRNLYEDFLIAHAGQPGLLPDARLPARTAMHAWLREHPDTPPLQTGDADISAGASADIAGTWADSVHARVDVNCSGCHTDGQMQFSSAEIVARCGSCHSEQRETFTQGKHGMRLSSRLPQDFVERAGAMSPQQALLPMRESASGELSCTSCHGPHETDLQFAAVEACLGCHNDEHSQAFTESAHFRQWSAGDPAGVSCAGCHLPRETHPGPQGGERILVNHNQNHNLRPNDKMLPVCLNCHGAEFALAALADEALIAHNFNRKPDAGHRTFDLIRERIKQIANNKKSQ